MSSCGNRWSGGFQGGGPVPSAGGGGGAGAFWIGDFLTLEAAELALASADVGAYADVFVSEKTPANFFGRFQHQLFGAIHHIKCISNCYISRCGAYDNSVLDFTDPARVGILSGALTVWKGGLTHSGDIDLALKFIGKSYVNFRQMSMEGLFWDAVGTPANNSVVMCGFVDVDTPTDRDIAGMGARTLLWACGAMHQSTVSLVASANVFLAPNDTMETAKSADARVTLWSNLMSNGISLSLSGRAISHTHADTSAVSGIATSFDPTSVNTPCIKIHSSESTTIQGVVECVSCSPMQTPASGY